MKLSPHLVRTTCPTPLGDVHLAASEQGLAGLWFEGQKHLPAQLDTRTEGTGRWLRADDHPLLQRARTQLRAYFEGQLRRFDLALDLSAGSAFQQAVWNALLGIGHGRQTTYGELAQALGQAGAARAVGAAVGRNPLSIIVPCHRVLGQGGRLTGYAGGLHRKTALLQLEGLAP